MIVFPVHLGHGCGLPIVTVNDVGLSTALQHPFQSCSTKVSKSLGIRQRNLQVVGTVNHANLEHTIVWIDEVSLHSLYGTAENMVVTATPLKAFLLLQVFDEIVLEDVVFRKNDFNFVPFRLNSQSE